ncbi:MAG: class I SAM-dependent methyltransferase, partial [Scytonema sp. PMC 1069.18]|nr:class I SAM-dependent methyltransferase [Scytonema sp. PMC 1069.18]MEC4881927.1 class I SAM-dependent methyltransferase [Scytonema sp. PMC 1070.18]
MEFTGERYVPSLGGEIKYEHLHRYALCIEFVTGKSVLDIASGEGYGSALMAQYAESVVGVDISSEVVDYAAHEYGKFNNLKFTVGSCDSVPLLNHSVEVVTSFETIEHHDQHEKMMQEIKRVLKPEGTLIISSPNRLTYSDEPQYQNPFHVKELYYEEFISLLKQHFKYVKVYGQRLAIGSFIYSLENGKESSFRSYMGDVNNVNERLISLESPIYFVAICSEQQNFTEKRMGSVYIDGSDDILKKFYNEFQNLYAQREHLLVNLEKLQSQAQQTQIELERSQVQVTQVQKQLEQLLLQSQQKQTELAHTHSQLQQTQTEL